MAAWTCEGAYVVAPASDFHYRAFISYSHADAAWGKWLHKALETWRAPSRRASKQSTPNPIPRTLNPVFLDREERASATDLGRTVNEALAHSEALIVICSPKAAKSRWVNEEVLAFKRMGRSERVFCLVVDGEPNATELPGRESEECFCPALRHRIDSQGQLTAERIEPIAADVRHGKDGKTNARLKLVAALLGVEFDAIKQREVRRHTRRMAVIATASCIGMAAMAVFTAVAVRERNDARLQRQQAEDLVGFMLGDLRVNLDAVGRLDLLDAVADHALRYFEAQADAGDADSRAERANALLLLGRVRLDQGKVADANRAFTESLRFSHTNAATSDQPALQLANVDAHFWLGAAAWQDGAIADALRQFQAALPTVTKLAASRPDDGDALQRMAWLQTNIGHVFEAQGDWRRAMDAYSAGLRVSQRLLASRPRDRAYRTELAVAHDNMGALLYARGQFDGAEQHYNAERAAFAEMVAEKPGDAEARTQLAIAQAYLAQVAESLGHTDSARDSLRQAKSIGESALAKDPDNIDKLGDLASYCRRLARNLRLTGNPSAAAPLLKQAAVLYARMVQRAPTTVRAQYGVAATLLEQAELARQTGDAVKARREASDARQAFARLLHVQNYEQSASLAIAEAYLLLGKLDMAAGRMPGARIQWSRALDALKLFGSASQDPEQLATRAELLTLLDRPSDAQGLIGKLDSMHYREPAFVAWRTQVVVANTPPPI
jgi:tetratricopeptide (TPR) repeat protein